MALFSKEIRNRSLFFADIFLSLFSFETAAYFLQISS